MVKGLVGGTGREKKGGDIGGMDTLAQKYTQFSIIYGHISGLKVNTHAAQLSSTATGR